MKTILKAGAVLAFLAVAAYGTQSNAEEPASAQGAAAASSADLLGATDQEDAVESEDLDKLNGRELLKSDALAQIAIPTNNNTSTGNDITLDGGSTLTTGLVEGTQANTGGINSMMQNTGNNVNFQNQTIVQVIMGP